MRVQKPVTWGFRAAPCFLAHGESSVPATQRATQSFCSHYIMESALICWCPVGIAGSSPHPYPRIRRKTQIYKMPCRKWRTWLWLLQASGSRIFGFVGWKEEQKMNTVIDRFTNKGMARCFSREQKMNFFTAMHLCSYCFMASFGLADWGHILMTFSITAHSIKMCKVVLN